MHEVIVITGASSGIGKALALNLATQEKTVYAIARNEEKLVALQEINPNYIHPIVADVATEDGRDKIKSSIPQNLKISHLVNNAGIMAPSGYLENVDLNRWRYQMAVNVEASLFLTQALLSRLSGGGRILNVSIYSSFKVLVGLGAYGSSKAALNMLTEYLKIELLKHDIAVGIVLPGLVDTPIQEQLSSKECSEIIERNKALREAGKLLKPEVVAKFLQWLLLDTDKQSFSNGIWDIYDKKHHHYWSGNLIIPTL